MDKTVWEKVQEVFHEALDETGLERRKVVEAACGDDGELLANVEGLLAAHEAAGEFLEEVTAAPVGNGLFEADGPDPLGLDGITERSRALQAHLAGRYSFEGELGRGGMGVVYLARDVSLDRPVAIKLLTTDLGGRMEARERFLQEARTSARLSHPNIVPVHAVEEHEEILFFVMAFVDGETVRERVKRSGPLAIGEVSRLLQEVAWALDYAHGRGVIHRDIKPDNIILETGTGRSVVTDFGIARAGASAGLTTVGALLGTPEYVSPEQALGNEVDGRSDVYSLGVTCFFALTGRLPFEADSVQGTLIKHVQEVPPSVTLFRPDVPRKLARAIDRCLAKDPKDRFGTAEGLAEAVAEARGQVVEVPGALRGVRREAESLVIDGMGFGALSAMVGFEMFAPISETWYGTITEMGDWGIRLAIWLLSIGIVGSRLIALIAGSRIALGQGFSFQHLGNAILRPIPEPHGLTNSRGGDGLPPILEASTLLAFLVLLAVGWIFIWEWTLAADSGLGSLLQIPLSISLFVLPVLVGRALGGKAIRKWRTTRRLWGRLWKGRLGRMVFRVSAAGLGKSQKLLPETQPTEVLVAGAVADLFDALPAEYQARLEELPDLVVRLEAAADALRKREAELERAIGAVGTVGSGMDQRSNQEALTSDSGGFGSVRDHRAQVAEDLGEARKVVGMRLSTTVAALENLRLGLLRLQAGVGSPDELTTNLKAAREIGIQVQALLEGERWVEGLLSDTRQVSDSIDDHEPGLGEV